MPRRVVFDSLWSLQSDARIHLMVENAYKTTLASAFVSSIAGLYRKWANNLGAGLAIALEFGVWIAMEFVAPERHCRRSLWD